MALFIVIGLGVAWPAIARGEGTAPAALPQNVPTPASASATAKAERVSTELELQISSVAPLSHYGGKVLLAELNPRFVLIGKVVWVQRPEVMAKDSLQGFAIHSPARLGIQGAARGATICLLLTRTISDGKTQWELRPTKPDAGCRGGG